MKLLVKSVYANGNTYFFNRELIATRKWSLSWHPHTKACRYGWYHNKTLLGGGLWMALNLPILGDFALWKNWEGKTYQR